MSKYKAAVLKVLAARHARRAWQAENLTAADLAWFRSPLGAQS